MKHFSHEHPVPLLLASIFGLFLAASGQKDCSISFPQPNRYQPVIASRNRGLLYPVSSWSIEVNSGETVDIVCNGLYNTLVSTQLPTLSATCDKNGILPLPPNFVLNCTRHEQVTLEVTSKRCGSTGNSNIDYIGWSFPQQGLISLIDVCVNKGTLSTEYAKHKLFGSMYNGKNVNWLPRSAFKPSTPYTKAYRIENQKEHLAFLLDSTTLANAYITGWGSGSYLAKGHLCACADYDIQTWRDATFEYINAVPQWQAFNNGNWRVLEEKIKRKSRTPTPRDLVIYTGAHEVLKLPDANNKLVSIYLFNTTNNRNNLAVPEKIWKIVLDEQKKEGVAFVLLNIPFNPQYPLQEPPLLCPDVCNQIKWVQWKDRNNRAKGKIYCCTVDSLVKNIPNLPITGNFTLMT